MDTLTLKDENTKPDMMMKNNEGKEIQKDKIQSKSDKKAPEIEIASETGELEKGVFEMVIDDENVEMEERCSFELGMIPETTREKAPMSKEVKYWIVHYVGACKRILEFQLDPVLHKLREEVPLRIKLLELNPNCMIIDTYKIEFTSVLLHMDGTPLPPGVIDRNKVGYFHFDVDKHGAEVRHDWTPGDVTIRGKYKQPFQGYGKKNTFDVFVRATAQHRGGQKKVQSLRDKISSLMKTMTDDILGGGQCHLVLDLRISRPGILRLPIGLKLTVKELSSLQYGLDVLDIIPQLIREDDLPLPSFCTFVSDPKDPIIKNPVFRSAESISIFLPENCQEQNWPLVLKKLKNKRITLFGHELHFKQYFPIVKDWISNPRPYLSSFSMAMKKFDYAMSAIQKLCGAMEVLNVHKTDGMFPTALCIPLNDELDLHIFPDYNTSKAPGVHILMTVLGKYSRRVVVRTTSV